MPPPSLPPPAAAFLYFASLIPFLATLASSNSCSSTSPETHISCPPFTSPPPFPFSLSLVPGCGHPSFQIRCSPSAAASISINNLSFSLLHYEPNSTSLTVSLAALPPPRLPHRNCSSAPTVSTLNGSISFSGSPFRVSDSSCSRLSVLKPCPPPNLPNCSRCSWECKVIKNLVHLIHDCGGAAARHR